MMSGLCFDYLSPDALSLSIAVDGSGTDVVVSWSPEDHRKRCN
jgi:hypothetical protein